MFTTPVVTGDTVVVGSCSGAVFGLDKVSGAVRWSFEPGRQGGAPSQFHGEPLPLGTMVLVPADDRLDGGGIHAFDSASGRPIWHAWVGNVPTDLAIKGDRVVGGTEAGGLVAVSLRDGGEQWRFAPSGPVSGRARTQAPIVAGETVYFGARDGALYALDVDDGAVAWRRSTGCIPSTRLEMAEGALWQGCDDGRLLRLSAFDGEVKASIDLPDRPHDALIVLEDGILTLVGSGALIRVEPDGSSVRWSYETEGEWSSFRPLVLDDTIIVGNDAGELHAVDIGTGARRWHRHVGGVVRGLGHRDRILYVGTLRGTVLAFEPVAQAREKPVP